MASTSAAASVEEVKTSLDQACTTYRDYETLQASSQIRPALHKTFEPNITAGEWNEETSIGGDCVERSVLDRLRRRQQHRGRMIAAGMSYEWHRAAWMNEVSKLRTILGWSENRWYETDSRGMTPLHVATLRGHLDAIIALVEAGCPVTLRDAKGWTPLDHAVATKQHAVARTLTELQSEPNESLDSALESAPDCRLEVRYENRSPFMCPFLLRRCTPSETFRATKAGSKLRIDFTLLYFGQSKEASLASMRGSFSLLKRGRRDPLIVVDRKRNLAFDASILAGRAAQADTVDALVQARLSDGPPVRDRLRLRAIRKVRRFKCFPDDSYKIASLQADAYDARASLDPKGGKVLSSLAREGSLTCSWEEYLGGYRADDDVILDLSDDDDDAMLLRSRHSTSRPNCIDDQPLSPTRTLLALYSSHSRRHLHDLKVRCWFAAPSFPLRISHILPFLTQLGLLSPDAPKFRRFLEQYFVQDGDLAGRFPIRLDVPIGFTVKARLALQRFDLIDSSETKHTIPEDAFDLPTDCDYLANYSLQDVLKRMRACDKANATARPSLAL